MCLEGYLRDHPLTALSNVNVEAVYNVIVAILSDERDNASALEGRLAADKPAGQTGQRVGSFVCPSCTSSVFTTDTREGDMICSGCGACVRLPSTNNHEYDKSTERRQPGDIKSKLPKWYNHVMTAVETKEYEIEEEMYKWVNNPYAHAKLDSSAYQLAKRRAAIPGRANATDRAVGAILTHFIVDKIDVHDIERRVRARQPLPLLTYERPAPRFACNKCGATVWTMWESRRHPCGWGKAARQRSFAQATSAARGKQVAARRHSSVVAGSGEG